MMGGVLFVIAIFVFCLIIAIAGYVDKSQKEKEKKKKDQAIREEVARTFEMQKRNKQLREERLRERQKARSAEFAEELSQIPLVQISLSEPGQDLKNYEDFPTDKLTILKPRNGVRKALYTDFTVVDVETTGLDIYDDIIEISAIKYIGLVPVSAFTSLIKPPGIIPREITDLTHIDAAMVANAPTIEQIMPAFIDYIGNDNLLAHNLPFDLKFLYRNGFDCFATERRYYDTLQIARSKIDKSSIENYKLPTLCEHYDIYRDNAHRSLSDCFAAGKIYIKLLDTYIFKSE